MMATIANLEIPAELAFVYSKIDEWELYHNSQPIITSPKDVVPMEMGFKLPVDINSHVFSKYVSNYFKNHNWCVQTEPIKTSLTPVKGEGNSSRAVAVFQLILRFMSDPHLNEKKAKIISDFIVQMGLQHEGIRDEILCQLTNQAWLNQNMEQAEKVWRQLTNCLCCFNPSPTLFKYLLKFVSDIKVNDYKQACQQKILQSANIHPLLCRVYPPTYLEWRAIQRKANMALEIHFPDDVLMTGHVESWTSGELFSAHLLKLRNLNENSQGWTVQLQEDVDYYELMGYDYLLDLISEVELVPGFPYNTGHFLVSVDHSRDRKHKKNGYPESPHNAEKERILILDGPLPQMMERKVPVATSSQGDEKHTRGKENLATKENNDLSFSKTSVLNQRSSVISQAGLSENSHMNVRYAKHIKTVQDINDHMTDGAAKVDKLTASKYEEEGHDLSDLASHKLNTRYLNSKDVRMTDTKDLSQSKLNKRYKQKSQIKTSGLSTEARLRGYSQEETDSDISDWSHLVEDIFSNALDDYDNQDGKTLNSRIKGGGQGLPGLNTQQPLAKPLNINFGLTNTDLTVNQPIVPALNLASSSTIPVVGLVSSDPFQQVSVRQVVQQQAAVQMAQQQAAVQAYLTQQQQALYQVGLQQQQQQTLQAEKQQTLALKAALEQQELQNKILKQSIEQETLKQQLQNMKMYQEIATVMPLPLTVPLPQTVQVVPSAPIMTTFTPLNQNTIFQSEVTGMEQMGPDENNSQMRVSDIKSTFESQREGIKSKIAIPPATKTTKIQSHFHTSSSSNVTDSQTKQTNTGNNMPFTSPIQPSAPPEIISQVQPSVPSQCSDIFALDAKSETQPAATPEVEINKEKGIFTIRDKSGQSRAIRVGKVVWPPPEEKLEKYDIRVGKLEIDEQLANGIKDQILGSKKKQKPELLKVDERLNSEEQDKKKMTRQVSSLESTYSNMMLILEEKLGSKRGSKTSAVNGTPLTVDNNAVHQSTDENVYTNSDEQGEIIPPSVPNSVPPKSAVRNKTESGVVATSAPKKISGNHTKFTERDVRFSKEIETISAPPLTEFEIKPQPKIDYGLFEQVITQLCPQNKIFLMYSKLPWTLHIRKEVFKPNETLENSLALHLVFCQIVGDVYNNGCVRITKDQRSKLRNMLGIHGVNQLNYLTKELKPLVKKIIVDTAKEWPTYFCRLFPASTSGQYSGMRYLGVSHSGLRLVTREKSHEGDHLFVLDDIKFEDVVDVVLPTSSTVQLNLKTKSLIFQTTRALQLKEMIDKYCHESGKGNEYVMAIQDHNLRGSTLLNFKQGDIIKLINPEMNLESGLMYGSLNGMVGQFPVEYVEQHSRQVCDISKNGPTTYQVRQTNDIARRVSNKNAPDVALLNQNGEQEDSTETTVTAVGKYSLIEYALLNFRNVQNKSDLIKKERTDKLTENIQFQNMRNLDGGQQGDGPSSWKNLAEQVKWTKFPIPASLHKFSSSDLNNLAVECFIAIMRFMGDYPMDPNMTDFTCAKKILKLCHRYPQLRDEVFCQLCKQTTDNRSLVSKSQIRGWRLFALFAAYFDCSDVLRPFLIKLLETTASDLNNTYNSAASLCLTYLRKTFRYGGRKDVPLMEEVMAIAEGRNCRRLPFFYSESGVHEGVLQVKTCTIVHEAIEEVCSGLNITDSVEKEEYTLFIRTGDGKFHKLNKEDYILDETGYYVQKEIPHDIIFMRTVWYFPPMHLENEIYLNMMFHQCVLDYIEGFLTVMPEHKLRPEILSDVIYLGAVLHRTRNKDENPTLKDLEVLLPRNVRHSSELKPQIWLKKINENFGTVARMSPAKAKARFIDILKRWPLFGSTFFLIKSIPNVVVETLLAVNHKGIAFLRKNSNDTIIQHPFSEILSVRHFCSENNINFLDMKLGNLMVHQVLRIETDQGPDIADLIGQYMEVINKHRGDHDKPNTFR